MSEMLPEIFEALAGDAAKAMEDAGEADARFLEQTADNEDLAVQRILDTDQQIANQAATIGERASQDTEAEALTGGAAGAGAGTEEGVLGALGPAGQGGPGALSDPAFEKSPLGEEYSPDVFDPAGEYSPKERAIANRLTEEGWRVDARAVDHTVENTPNPDAMVRKNPDDPGSVTEFKTMDSSSQAALKREINRASVQAGTDGEVVIDGRGVGTTQAAAERAFRRALGQPGGTVSQRVHVILGDGSLVTFERE
jgi:hypothetical protein